MLTPTLKTQFMCTLPWDESMMSCNDLKLKTRGMLKWDSSPTMCLHLNWFDDGEYDWAWGRCGRHVMLRSRQVEMLTLIPKCTLVFTNDISHMLIMVISALWTLGYHPYCGCFLLLVIDRVVSTVWFYEFHKWDLHLTMIHRRTSTKSGCSN